MHYKCRAYGLGASLLFQKKFSEEIPALLPSYDMKK